MSELKAIINFYFKEGKSINEIATKLNLSNHTVQDVIRIYREETSSWVKRLVGCLKSLQVSVL